MNAQQLVQLRKEGSISQEEFFIGLNSLRRQNSEVHQQQEKLGRSTSAQLEFSVNSNRPAVVEVVKDSCKRKIDPRSGSAAALPPGGGAVVLGVPAAESSPWDYNQNASSATQRSDNNTTDSSHGDACSSDSARSLSLKEPVPHGGAQLRDEPDGSAATPPEPPSHGSVSHPASLEAGFQEQLSGDDLSGNHRPGSRCRVDDGEGTYREISAGEEKCDSGWLVSPRGERTQQSTSSRRRRRTKLASPESQPPQAYRGDCEGDNGRLCGSQAWPAEARLSPMEGSDDRDEVAAAVVHTRIEARGEVLQPQPLPQGRKLSRSQPVTPPSRSNDGRTRRRRNAADSLHGLCQSGSVTLSARGRETGRTSATSEPEESVVVGDQATASAWTGKARVPGGDSSSTGRCHGLGRSFARVARDPVPCRGSQKQQHLRPIACQQGWFPPSPPSPAARGTVRQSRISRAPCSSRRRDHGTSVLRSAVSPGSAQRDLAAGRWRAAGSGNVTSGINGGTESDIARSPRRSRGRHLESAGGSPACGRRSRQSRSGGRSRNGVTSRDPSCRCTMVATARRDHFGYPLPGRECLGGSNVVGGCCCFGGGGNGGGYTCSPAIKDLPEFYEYRQRRGHDEPIGSTIGSALEVGAGPPPPSLLSLYRRTTGWQARAKELRAQKLAQREEQEMNACTFQPNVSRKPNPVGAPAAPTSGAHVPAGSDARLEFERDGSSGDGGATTAASGCCGCGDGDGGGSGAGAGCGGRGEDVMSCTVGGHVETRVSAAGKGGAVSPQQSLAGTAAVAHRLFQESRRLKERRFEGQERKRMAEEEEYARTCTFEPSLAQTSASNARVASRYRDQPRAASAPPTGRRRYFDEEALTFHPKILGVQPGMARALEYVSLGVTERLYRPAPHPNNHRQPHRPPPTDGMGCSSDYSTSRYSAGEQRQWPHEHFDCDSYDGDEDLREREGGTKGGGGRGRGGGRSGDRGATATSPPSEGLVRCWDHRGGRDSGFGRPRQGERTPLSAAPGTEAGGRGEWLVPPERVAAGGGFLRRPRSAPAARGEPGGGAADGGSGRSAAASWAGGDTRGRRRTRGRKTGEWKGGGEGVEEGPRWPERRSYQRHGGGGEGRKVGVTGGRRQNPISFGEFLARQAHSQAAATQHLRRLTAQQSPSFTPRLSRGTRRIVAKSGGAAAAAGGGRFEERLGVTARRRSRDRKAAILAARKLEREACTFAPKLTPRATALRSRSARELSLGDSVLREAKMRMARAREDIRLTDNPDGYPNAIDGCTFAPKLATAGDDGLAPQASSRLMLADALDTYLDRVQEAAGHREERLLLQKQRQQAAEDGACTFQPEITASCPELVRRTAAGMRCVREFRRRQNLESGEAAVPARPTWRYT